MDDLFFFKVKEANDLLSIVKSNTIDNIRSYLINTVRIIIKKYEELEEVHLTAYSEYNDEDYEDFGLKDIYIKLKNSEEVIWLSGDEELDLNQDMLTALLDLYNNLMELNPEILVGIITIGKLVVSATEAYEERYYG